MNNFPGQALNFVVIVKEIENEQVTDFGFNKTGLTDKSEKYKKGIIVSMGVSCPQDDVHTVKVGDTILYDGYKTSPLSVEGEEYKTLMYSDMVMSF
jgi:co-chaperonin GroES (HSP10)